MKKNLLLAILAVLLNGCALYHGGSNSGDSAGNEGNIERGTTGVSSGADPGPGITGSGFAPP
jgi:hypothetical protein